MNAKEAEARTGISRRNLRFYEQQGLIHPRRNEENDYRDYSEADIETLKMIRALRMLDAPLEDISACLRQEMTVTELSAAQEARLKQRQQEVETSIRFCQKLQKAPEVDAQYIDALLRQMDAPEVQKTLFDDWKRDYQKVAAAEAKRAFSFTPEDAITTAEEFTAALRAYARENQGDLVITREGLEPEFTLDGVAYMAQRVYRRMGPVPVLVVRCTALHPEELAAEVPGTRGKVMGFLCRWWPLLLFLLIWLPRVASAEPGKRGEMLLVGGILAISYAALYGVFRNHRN